MEKEAIIKLTENFFRNLKCDINWDSNKLIITKVPEEFEKVYEKSSPYIFTFDETHFKENPESELVTRGSIILKLMASFLENKAKTSLLKINFNPDLLDIVRKDIDFRDYKIVNLVKSERKDYIFRFIFITTLQYLNEKEQIISKIYTKNNSILEGFDLDLYPTITGKSDEIKKEKELIEDTKINYNISKEGLKKSIQERIEAVSIQLNRSLERAVNRVNSHYSNLLSEMYKGVEKENENLILLNEKLIRSNDKNKEAISEKIKKLEENKKNPKNKEDMEKLEKEKLFFISDEKSKHSLNLNNSLMNTSVIYYSIFDFKIAIRDKNNFSREIKLSYDPLKEKLSELVCEKCNKKISQINLCDFGHLSCLDCLDKCPRCGKKVCKSCKQINCNICSGRICEKCASICNVCKKPICNSDIRRDSIIGKNICIICSDFCSSCNSFSDKTKFKQCENCRGKFCYNCIRTKYVNGKAKLICKNCAGIK